MNTEKQRKRGQRAESAQNARLQTELYHLRRGRLAEIPAVSDNGYRFLLDTTSDGLFEWRLDEPLDTTLPVEEQVQRLYKGLTLCGCNRAFAEQYRLPSSLINKGLRLHNVPFAGSPSHYELIRRYILNGYRSEGEMTEEINLSGERRWFLKRIVSRVENGFVYDGWGVQTDITQLRSAQEAVFSERENAAGQRAAELAKATVALQNSVSHLAGAKDLSEFINAVLHSSIEQTGATSGALFRYDPNTESVRMQAFIRDEQRIDIQSDPRMELWRRTFATSEFAEGWRKMLTLPEGYFVQGIATDEPDSAEGVGAWHVAMGHHSVASFPLLRGEEPVGFIGLAFSRPFSLTPEKIELVRALCQQATLALELSRLAEEAKQIAVAKEQEKAAQERARELAKANAAFQETIDALATINDLENLIPAVLRVVGRTFSATCCAFFEHADDELVYLRYFCINQEVLPPCQLQSLYASMSAITAQLAQGFKAPFEYLGSTPTDRTRPVVLDHLTGTCKPEFDAYALTFGGEIELNVPLVIGGKALGALVIFREAKTPYGENDIALAEALGKQLAFAMQSSRLAECAKLTAIAKEKEKAAQQRAGALERVNATLRESVGKLSQQNDVSLFLAETLGEIVRQMNAANGLILIVNEENRMAQLHLFHDGTTARWGMSGNELPLFADPFSADITPAFKIMCREHQPICFSRTRLLIPNEQFAFPGAIDYMARIGASDSAIIALRAGKRVIGTLHLQFVDGTVLREEDEPLFVAMSQQAAIAMRLTELAAESQQAAVVGERNRLAQEIHDTLAHSFNSIKFLLEATESGTMLPSRQHEVIARARELASEGAREARRSVWALRPEGLERGNLLSALSAVTRQHTMESILHVELSVEGELFALHPEVEDNLLRVTQEALANVTNHARANRVDITLVCRAPELTLCIRDNGIGFIPGQTKRGTGFGLGGMRERVNRLGGHLHITSAPGTGAEIRAVIPDAQ